MSRMLRWITAIAGLISIVSCNNSAHTPTLSPQAEPIDASPTPRTVPSPVRLVTATSMPTVTSRPEPQAPSSASPLMSTGPYFVFARNRELNQIIVTNQDGSGRKVVNLPTGLTVNQWFYRDFSPNGNRLVVFRRDFAATPPEMELYILQLPGAGLTKVANLLAPDYPAGLVEVARRWPTELPGLFSPSEDWIGRAEDDVLESLLSPSWSTDGRFLAFASQEAGLSLDVYVYDTELGTTRRLTDDIQNVDELEWTPDNEWLMLRNAIVGDQYNGATLHRLDPTGTVVSQSASWERGFLWHGLRWLSKREYLIGNIFDGGVGNLRLLNVSTGAATEIWPAFYVAYTADVQGRRFFVSAGNDASGIYSDTTPGLYVVPIGGGATQLSRRVYWDLQYVNGSTGALLAGSERGVYQIDMNGNERLVSALREPSIVLAPNAQRYAAYNSDGVEILDADGRVESELEARGVQGVTWTPDSRGLMIVGSSEIVHYSVSDRNLTVIDQCETTDCSFSIGQVGWSP